MEQNNLLRVLNGQCRPPWQQSRVGDDARAKLRDGLNGSRHNRPLPGLRRGPF
jgi:hypothetical protein